MYNVQQIKHSKLFTKELINIWITKQKFDEIEEFPYEDISC